MYLPLPSGASSLGSVFHATDDSESVEVVHEAVKSGINYIDTAPWYGHGKSETVLGKVKNENFISPSFGHRPFSSGHEF